MWDHYSARGQIGTVTVREALAGPAWPLHSIVGWVKNLPQTTVSHQNFFGTSNPTSMFFYPTTTFELSRLISETPSKFSVGWDGIPSILLKYLPIVSTELCF